MIKTVQTEEMRNVYCTMSEDEQCTPPTTREELPASPAAGVVGPNTPQTEAGRRTRRKLIRGDADSLGEGDGDHVADSANGDDQGATMAMEEPIAISRVRANASSKDADGRQPKVTLERARAKLDVVKASREKNSKSKKSENLLNGIGTDIVYRSPSPEIQGRAQVLKQKGALLERACTNLEAVNRTKVPEISKVYGRRSTKSSCSELPPERTRAKALGFDSGSEELTEEGVWVEEAKMKLHSARAKKSKPGRKRAFKSAVTKKKGVSKSETPSSVSCIDGAVDDVGVSRGAAGVVCTSNGSMVEKAKANLRGMKAKTPKANRTSEHNANRQSTTQQDLDTQFCDFVDRSSDDIDMASPEQDDPDADTPPGVNGEEGGVTLKAGSERQTRLQTRLQALVKPSSIRSGRIRSDSRGEVLVEEEDTQGAISTGGRELSPDISVGITSSVEITPPAKRRRKQQVLLVEITPPVGARLSSSVKWVPPVSPFGLIQEQLYQDPWKVLVACMLLNKTGGHQMHKVIWDLFELCPDAETCVSTETEKIGVLIHSLGLQNKRAKMLQRFSKEYLGADWTNVTQLHGIGEYARDAYAIFCEGRWREVQPNDHMLTKYWRWLCDTQGLGYGFSQ